mgnify:CR=1 FL=1
MKPGWRDAFERLEPPPGGLGRLRGRLAEKERSGRAVWAFRLAAAAVAALAAIVLWVTLPTERRSSAVDGSGLLDGPSSGAAAPTDRLTDHPLLIAAGLLAASAEPVALREPTVAEAALLRFDVADPDVAFYLVGMSVRR